MDLVIKYFNLNKYYLFFGLVFANILTMWLSKSTLLTEMIFYNTYSEQLSYERSQELFEGMKKFSWIGYALMPIALIIKFSLTSILIFIGIFFCDLHEKIDFKSIFGVVLASEVVFLVASIFKFFWFSFFVGNYDLNDLRFFYPLSLANLFSQSEVEKMWVFPLQMINLFQIAYILLLSYGIRVITGIQQAKVEKAILISYIPGMLSWVVLVMFLTVV